MCIRDRDVTEDGMEEIIEPQVEENKPEPQRELRRLSYGNRNGNGSGLRINRF